MRLFYFIAQNISYTFAISFYTIIIGGVVTFLGYFLGSTFIVFPYEIIIKLVYKWLPVSMFAVSLIYFLEYGFFTPIKIPALFKFLRIINTSFKINFNVSNDELKKLYNYISDLPLSTAILAIVNSSLIGILFAAFSFYEYKFKGSISYENFIDIMKIINISMLLVVMLNTMISYLSAEYLTNQERTLIYNKIILSGQPQKPRALIGIRFKFMFFIMLMIITLLSFAALMEKSRLNEDYNIGFIIVNFILSMIAGIVIMQVNTSSIVRALRDLRRVTKEIAAGGKANFNVMSLENEFASIEFALMEMSWEIEGHRKNLEQKVEQRTNELQNALSDLKGKDDQMQKQLDMASIIQRSILPTKIEDWNELKFCVRYIAMEKIGGDFYDIYQLKNSKFGFMIADVSGHGIPAALVTTMAKISFTNASIKYDSPRRIFQDVNKNILDHVKTQDYMTCFMVAIDEEYNVVYSNASHQKAILLRTEESKIELLDTNGLFIGAIEEASESYDELSVKMNYGDRIILYTDGIPEANNEGRKDYSNARLEEVIIVNRRLPLDEFANFILEDVQRHIGNASVEDDITLIVIELARDEAVDIIKTSKKLINTHKYTEAIDLLEKGLVKYPNNQKLLYNLGKNFFRINNFSKSISSFEKYLANDKRNKHAFYINGSSYYQMFDYDNAILNYEKALEIDSNYVIALFAIAMCYKKKGDIINATKTFEKVVNIDPDNKMALFELKEING